MLNIVTIHAIRKTLSLSKPLKLLLLSLAVSDLGVGLTTQPLFVGGDRRAGARENRGREGHGRRERKGREAGVLGGREAGEQYKTVNFFTY